MMSMLNKVKNMSNKKSEERSRNGTANDRGYDLFKVISGIQMTVSMIVLTAILTVLINMNNTSTSNRITTSNQGIEITYLKTNVESNTERLTKVESNLNVKDFTVN